MPVIQVYKGYKIRCDRCGYVPAHHVGDKKRIERIAKKEKWTLTEDGKTYCAGCQMIIERGTYGQQPRD